MNKNKVLKEHHIAKKASVSAGELLLNKNSITEIFSSDKDIKLTADIQAEQIIKDIISAESSYPILAEESGKSVEKLGDTYWIIDPLDGTANYSRSIPISAVSICLMHQLNPVLGVIYDFNNDHLYEGSIVSDALLNDQKIKVSSIDNSKSGMLITGLPNNTDYSDKALTRMIRDFQDWRKVRMLGSAAMAAAYVASGKADVYKEKNSYIWDVAAGAAIVKAAGGYVSLANQNESFQVDVFFSNGHILG
ncbi:MAG: inositol monophosphatase family protein [Gammaproteobacteria bacterium]